MQLVICVHNITPQTYLYHTSNYNITAINKKGLNKVIPAHKRCGKRHGNNREQEPIVK